MFKNILGGIAALAMIAILALLIVQSRSVNETYYSSHVTRLNQLELAEVDSESIIQGLRSARNDARPIPESVNAGFARLREATASLAESIDPAQLGANVAQPAAEYSEAVDAFIAQCQTVAEHQTTLADSLAQLQAESPAAVNDFRRFKLDLQAQNTFTVTLDVLDYATGKITSGTSNLRSRLSALKYDPDVDVQAPGRLDHLMSLAQTVLREYDAAKKAMLAIDHAAFQSATHEFSNTLLAANRELVGKAERARFLLSVFSALLLAGVGFIGFRLHQSYRALNVTNQTLEQVNGSLEERVAARTDELSSAYEELKESQVQLVQAEKMSSLGALVAGISHEINTPLWYLISNTTVIRDRLKAAKALADTATTMVSAVQSRQNVQQALSEGLNSLNELIKDGIDEDIDEAHDLIEDSIQGLNDLTEMAQSLKDFSRLDRAPVGQFDINEGLDKTLKIVKNKIKERITVNKHYSELPAITCSPSQINQIFLNLISNAADAIEDSGEITISTHHEDDRVLVRITDTGCGIPEDALEKIRDPFFTTKEVGQGTGLGLSIVEKIVKAHHGELRIDSTEGEGSVFTVDLPVEAMTSATPDDAVDDVGTATASAAVAPVDNSDIDDAIPTLAPA